MTLQVIIITVSCPAGIIGGKVGLVTSGNQGHRHVCNVNSGGGGREMGEGGGGCFVYANIWIFPLKIQCSAIRMNF